MELGSKFDHFRGRILKKLFPQFKFVNRYVSSMCVLMCCLISELLSSDIIFISDESKVNQRPCKTLETGVENQISCTVLGESAP